MSASLYVSRRTRKKELNVGSRNSAVVTVIAALVIVAACAGRPLATPAKSASVAPTTAPTPTADPTPVVVEGKFDVGGFDLWIHCEGTGSPTVLLESGLGSDSHAWPSVFPAIAEDTRTCKYDRAGLGESAGRPGYSASAGSMAGEGHRLLEAAGLAGPFVVAGHSYGGMIARILANTYPKDVAGLVLVDASSGHQFEGEWLAGDSPWYDRGTTIDREASAAELASIKSLGSIPVIVLTQGQMSGDFEASWSRFQDELATLSSNSLHMVARNSGHSIQDDAADLVNASIRAVVQAVRSGGTLPSCDAAFEAVGAECVATTMTAQVEAWQQLRASVVPVAGVLPSGVYRAELTGAQAEAASGKHESFNLVVFTWTLSGGRWELSIVEDGGTPDVISDVYAAAAGEVTIRLPLDWAIPRTPGVNRLKWTVDADRTLHFTQVDGELVEAVYTVPWLRVGEAPPR